MVTSSRPPSVLLISLDGVAPRHVTRQRMPALTGLARQGAACFRARTVLPSVTLPAHVSMTRSVGPATHRVADNEPVTPEGPPSVLSAARSGGRSTAAFQSWLPFDSMWEPDALSARVTLDAGYDFDADERILALAARHLGSDQGRPDQGEVVFVYFSLPDLIGHEHGWDSDEYRRALSSTDERLGRLLAGLEPTWSVVVTTDHGGHDRTHGTDHPDDVETFVVARGDRLRACSVWAGASILDVAPTVADLAGVAQPEGWEGRSLVGTEVPLVDVVVDRLKAMAGERYGEDVTLLEHSLQTAAMARHRGADDALVLAALLHDVGHPLGDADPLIDGRAGAWGLADHDEAGARLLQAWFSADVVEPIRLHVEAKRYLVAAEPGYVDELSEASLHTLAEQGGPLDAEAMARFDQHRHSRSALQLRRFDDGGKLVGEERTVKIDDPDAYRPLLAAALDASNPNVDTVDPTWARHACGCPQCRDPGNQQCLLAVEDLVGWTVVAVRGAGGSEVDLVRADGTRHTAVVGAANAHQHAAGRDGDDLAVRWWGAAELGRLQADTVGADEADVVARFARRLATAGIAIADGVATESGEVVAFAERLGFVRETNYGRLFDVVVDADPINLAYTSAGLPLHTDNPYREPCPTVQLLHCLVAAEGGASRFADGYRAADRLRHLDPDGFDVLTTTTVEFRFRSPGVDLRARRPVIELDADGTVRAVSVNNRSMEPPSLAGSDARRFYTAYRRFVDLVTSDDAKVELTLRPGQLVGFDNRRVLHGRAGFVASSPRHLQGCYLDIDAVRSLARTAPSSRRHEA